MIALIKGKLIALNNSSVIVECNGIGFEIFSSTSDIAKLEESKGKDITLFTHLAHKEESMTLYGFLNEKTKDFKNIEC